MNESCHVWISHVPNSRSCPKFSLMSQIFADVVSRMYESCRICMCYVSCVCVMLHIKKSCHTWKWVMSHVEMSHVTHMNQSCHTYEWVMPHISRSHGTHMNESRHSDEHVICVPWLIHMCDIYSDASIKEWCHTRLCVMSHTLRSDVTHAYESCRTRLGVISHTLMSHVAHA